MTSSIKTSIFTFDIPVNCLGARCGGKTHYSTALEIKACRIIIFHKKWPYPHKDKSLIVIPLLNQTSYLQFQRMAINLYNNYTQVILHVVISLKVQKEQFQFFQNKLLYYS